METDGSIQLPLLSRRRERGQLFQKLQHVIPAVPLLGAGIQGLIHGERGFALALAVAEIVTSALLLRSTAQELRAFRSSHDSEHAAHHGVDWFEIFAAGVLTVEALEHWHTHSHLPRPSFLMAAVTLGLGLFHGRIAEFSARRRSLRIDATGLRIGSRVLFNHFSVPWADLERIDFDDRYARIVARNGRKRRIDLKDLRNASEVREALLSVQARLTH
ncbi:MAG TPA: hypothetical protein VH394_25010 [Thermoanaerobaculia bacterium]|nr:hypothetical protein [Thermoanaerobaculia bacterium]